MKIKYMGEFNNLFPFIFYQMYKQGRKSQVDYMPALYTNFISPYRLNLIHYFAYNDNAGCLKALLDLGGKYWIDHFGKSPLLYSMSRGSFECTQILLDYIMEKEDIYSAIEENEINQLIVTSPTNLIDFFNDSVDTLDKNVPHYGSVSDSEATFKIFD